MGLYETIVSSKVVPGVLHMKFRSEFRDGFTNRGCFHSAALKALTRFQEKKSKDMQFFLQNVQTEIFKIFKMFRNNIKFTRVNSKISNRQKHQAQNILFLSLLLVIIML